MSDFGISSIIGAAGGATYFTSSAFAGSVRWMAFELLRPDVHDTTQLTPRCDVWSYGSLILEVGRTISASSSLFRFTHDSYSCVLPSRHFTQVLTGKVPYHQFESDREVVHEIMRGNKPKHAGAGISADICMFIESCWSDDPSRRPSASAVVRTITRLRDDRLGYCT